MTTPQLLYRYHFEFVAENGDISLYTLTPEQASYLEQVSLARVIEIDARLRQQLTSCRGSGTIHRVGNREMEQIPSGSAGTSV